MDLLKFNSRPLPSSHEPTVISVDQRPLALSPPKRSCYFRASDILIWLVNNDELTPLPRLSLSTNSPQWVKLIKQLLFLNACNLFYGV